MKRGLIFLAIVLPTMALLFFGLTRDPRELPCALLGKPAPDFALQTLDGESVHLAALRGNPVILNFWSTWCGTCAAEHAVICQARDRYAGQGVQLYSVLYSDTVENARGFLTRYGKAAPILLDHDLHTAIDYGVAGVPETFFIDRQGIVRYKHTGPLTPDVVTRQLKALESPSP